jgi:hypothetical protein
MLEAHLLLDRLGTSLSGSPIIADEHGSAGVKLSDGSTLGLQIDSQANELWLYADLGAMPDTPNLPEEILQSQLFGRHTGGGSIAIGPGLDGEPRLLLWRSLPIAGLGEQTLVAVLQRLGDAAAAWRKALDAESETGRQISDADSPEHWLDSPPSGAPTPLAAPNAEHSPPPRGFA